MNGLPLLLWLLLALPAAAATVYRSVDANGVVQYSDRPPPGAVSEELDLEVPKPDPSPEVAERLEAMRAFSDSRQAARRDAERAARPGPYYYAPAPPPSGDYAEPQRLWYPVYVPSRGRAPAWQDRSRWTQPTPGLTPNPDSLSPRGLKQRLREARPGPPNRNGAGG